MTPADLRRLAAVLAEADQLVESVRAEVRPYARAGKNDDTYQLMCHLLDNRAARAHIRMMLPLEDET